MSRGRRRRPAPPPPTRGRAMELLRRPLITEKATRAGELNQYFFLVPTDSDKREIASAVEQIFKVNVVSVNTLRQRGKVKQFRGQYGSRAETKKAMVTVAPGQVIDFVSGTR
ncbi:MAG: 50S ribosomal protein L23 [Alphaproteobacteria bacterium]|nr:50S ribosomal protein L23 [Alphaproteobacteria bacterium]MDA7982561.1 50S ribosomal protein L23 [Alphaproteobacteria bacterium]MDA7983955.1 50S ribosomal protein L23 [Alphaproteobacteria bacterium]MDA7986949.1 50S ribosomal protein L23 [Alphaproteobacteria bacterium]MDA7988120.1 50S ribosomal protein L23 [Alphaproteobacteria bacterium]